MQQGGMMATATSTHCPNPRLPPRPGISGHHPPHHRHIGTVLRITAAQVHRTGGRQAKRIGAPNSPVTGPPNA